MQIVKKPVFPYICQCLHRVLLKSVQNWGKGRILKLLTLVHQMCELVQMMLIGHSDRLLANMHECDRGTRLKLPSCNTAYCNTAYCCYKSRIANVNVKCSTFNSELILNSGQEKETLVMP